MHAGLKRAADGFCFAVGLAATAWTHVRMATAAYGVSGFDHSLRLLQSVYAARGLTPYKDYGFFYPPGLAWLYGDLLGLRDPAAVESASAAVDLILAVMCAVQIMRLAAARRLLAGGVAFLILGGLVPLIAQIDQIEPNSLLLPPFILLSMTVVVARGVSPMRLACVVLAAALGVLLRWDRVIFTAALQMLAAAGLWGGLGLRRRHAVDIHARQLAARFCLAVAALLGGALFALAALAAATLATGSGRQAFAFIFQLPILILPYRHLPLPWTPGSDLQWLINIASLFLAALSVGAVLATDRVRLTSRIYILQSALFLAACVALLPYTFARADFSHFMPLAVMIMTMILAALVLWPPHRAHWLLLAALGLVIMPLLWRIDETRITRHGAPPTDMRDLHTLTDACTQLFPPDARSLFVGQNSYDIFINNFPILYLMRPDLRPATPFISDEPGVQNSCIYGDIIAADLRQAPRPLVLALDTTLWQPEPNLTRSMTSCGKIEAAIAALPVTAIGRCQLYGHIFTIGVAR